MIGSAEPSANWSLKEDIRAYWSKRASTFDEAFGHRILPGPELEAWIRVIREHLGPTPIEVLELASGTGEITKILRVLGHTVTGLDFSEAMIARARVKHRGDSRANFVLADAENTMESGDAYDAVVCRHLVWTLTDPTAALRDWHRVLRPGGRLLIFDGNFVHPPWYGRVAQRAMCAFPSRRAPLYRDASLSAEHKAILSRLPFRNGLEFAMLRDLAEQACFRDVRFKSYRPITQAQRRVASLEDWLGTWLYRRFILVARKSLST